MIKKKIVKYFTKILGATSALGHQHQSMYSCSLKYSKLDQLELEHGPQKLLPA